MLTHDHDHNSQLTTHVYVYAERGALCAQADRIVAPPTPFARNTMKHYLREQCKCCRGMAFRAIISVVFISICSCVHFAPTSSTSVPQRTLEHYASSSRVKLENLYSILDDNRTITVHVVPHTHDDVGWLKTVDEYYYGGTIIRLPY